MQYLKADTETKVVIGPVVAVGDGFTPVTTLSLSTADEAEMLKHDASAVTDISGNTFAAITGADGYYNLTLTAAQLDTEGRLTVLINDDSLCLPVRHDFIVQNANVFDSLHAAATTDYLQTDVTQVSSSATAADNLEFQYDGTTGLSGDTFPSTQAAVADIGSSTSGAIKYAADTDNVSTAIKGAAFVGSVTGGSLSNTEVEDGSVYEITASASDVDIVLGYSLDGGMQGVNAEILANVNNNADEMVVKAYNFVGAAWESIGTLSGAGGGGAFIRLNLSLLSRHTGTGSELGKVYIRFDTETTTPALLQIDKCIIGAVSTSRSVGYSNGSIWIDTTGGTAGTESYINGVADNPVSSYANALTIASNIDIHRFTFTAGDNITITQSHAIDAFFGYNYQVAMNNQVPPSYIEGAEITGICNGTATHYVRDCRIGTTTTPLTLNAGCVFVNSGLVDVSLKDAAAAALDIEFLDCHGNTQGSMFPGGNVDFGLTAGTNHEVSFQRWGGPCTITNLKAGDTVYAHGNGTFILDSSCTGGSFRVAGMINLTDNSGGAVSILEDGRLTRSGIYSEFIDGTNADAFKADVSALATSASIAALNDLSSADVTAAVPTVGQTADAVWDEALSGHNVGGSAGKAIRQVKEASITVESSINDLSATTTSFVTDLTEATDDFYNDKVLVFNSGTLSGQARVISDYNGTTKVITLDEALTSAPSDADSFIIIATHEHSIAQIQSGLATSAALATVDSNVDAVKLKTDLIPSDFTNQWNNVYDVQITGITTTVETAAGKHSVAGTVMMSTNAALAGGVLTAKKPSDDTTFQTYTITTSASADNITGVS